MILRNFKFEDLDEIIKVNDESRLNPLSRIIWTFISVSTHILVVEVEKEIAGFMVFGYENWSTLHLYHMATRKGHERKGIASMLISQLDHKKACSLITVASNHIAIRLYEKNGFRISKHFVKQNASMVLLRREANA